MDTSAVTLTTLTKVLSRHPLEKVYLEALAKGMGDACQVEVLAERFVSRIPGTRRVEVKIGGGGDAYAMVGTEVGDVGAVAEVQDRLDTDMPVSPQAA